MNLATRARNYAQLVALPHTVFALPFAASALVLVRRVPHVPLTALRLGTMLVAIVAARTSAMAFNRWADRDVDALNPRTRSRHVPRGVVRPGEALALAVVAGLAFLAAAASLGFWPAVLAPVVLAILLGYSYAKRFTWGAHAWLGLALALAPGGAWIAAGARPGAGIVLVMVAVLTWLFGFDVLYSLQDEGFDREHGLSSVPARFGARGALVLSAVSHVGTVGALAVAGVALGRGVFFAVGVVLTGGLLVYEHGLVGWPTKGEAPNLARIDKAFFDVNAWVSVAFFALVVADEIARSVGGL